MANKLAEAKGRGIGLKNLIFGKKKVTKEMNPEGTYVYKTKERVKGEGENTITRKKEKIRRTFKGAIDQEPRVSWMSPSQKKQLKKQFSSSTKEPEVSDVLNKKVKKEEKGKNDFDKFKIKVEATRAENKPSFKDIKDRIEDSKNETIRKEESRYKDRMEQQSMKNRLK